MPADPPSPPVLRASDADRDRVISPEAGDDTPETLHIRLVGKMKHGGISARWVPSRR